jgi:glycosidase
MEARIAREGRDPDRRKRGGGDLYKVVFDRRYGGDLQGVVQKLDDLKALGVTALYLNPIFQARSLHKYDASDFRHIDSALGNPPEAGPSAPIDETYYTPPAGETADPATWTWTPADRYFVDVFLPECKKRGLRVILDGVWNHTGREFFAFEDLQKNGRNSPYASWYQAEFDQQGTLVGWSGWENKNGYLPEFRQVKGTGRDWDTTVEKGDLNAGAKEHIFAITKRWMDPNGDGDPSDGIDGWRLDVVPDVGMAFWHSWRAHVRAINPDAIVVCEVWHDADEYMNPDKDGNPPSFDTQMHYPFAFPVLEWLVNMDAKQRPVSAQRLADALVPAFDNSPQTNLIHQNLFASHDTDRFASMLFNPGRSGYDRDNNIQGGAKNYKEGKPDAHAFQLALMGMAIQATYLGSPMIYYGDEVGMWGADDPTCRKPMQWDDAGVPANKDDSRNDAIRAEYAKWMALRQHPNFGQVLRYGDVRFIACDFDSRFLFERSLNGNRVIVLVNRSDNAIDLKGLKAGIADLREGAGKDTITPAWGVRAWGVDTRGTVAPLATLGSVSK